MEVSVCGVRLHYEQYGQGDRHILMLHGWGCSTTHFQPIANDLQADYHVTVIDFPAHGQSSEPPVPWGVSNFAACIKALIKQLGIAPCDIIAHSFGGRIALYLAANEPQLVSRLLLTGCAGIRKPQTAEQRKRSARYQRLKQLFQQFGKLAPFKAPAEKALHALRRKYGSADYNALSESMRQTFVRIVSEDLSPLLPCIKAPTLLIFGENDQDTPLWMGQQMEREIHDAGLVVFENDDHFAYLHQWPRFVCVARAFLK